MRVTASYSNEGLLADTFSPYSEDRGRVSAIGVRVGFLSGFCEGHSTTLTDTIFLRQRYSGTTNIAGLLI